MQNDPVASFIAAHTRKEPHSPVNFWLLIFLALILMALAITFLGDGRAPELTGDQAQTEEEKERPSRIYTVTFKFGVFSPTNLRIRAGDTVIFKNIDSRGIRILSQLNPSTQRSEFDSVGEVPPGSSFSYTFISEGIHAYYNAADERQAGVIIVRAR